LRRDIRSCLDDHNIEIGLIDCLFISTDRDASSYSATLDVAVELGATRVNTLSTVTWEKTVDEIGILAELAGERGLTVTIENFPLFTIGTLRQAITLIDALSAPNIKLLVDTLHVFRSGEANDLAAIESNLIDYVQISDGPRISPGPDAYLYEAANERMVPGTGALPLADMLRALPGNVIVSAEVPSLARQKAGVSDLDRARAVASAVQTLVHAAHKARVQRDSSVAQRSQGG
jgi:sugar phosphate isomerase/epimerase